MSRAQQGAIESTETANSATETAKSDASQAAEQTDIGNQQSQLAKFSANNPYVQGGQAETVENQQLSNTADSTAAAAKAKNQTQAVRTGQNATAGVAAGEAEQQAAQRTLSADEAGATQSRLASGAQYGNEVLNAGNQIVNDQNQLGSQESGQAQGQESTAEQAANTPSFLDELGAGLASAPAAFAGGAGAGLCPARGTLYLMADGSSLAVEDLTVGDILEGIDGEQQTIWMIETAIVPIVKVTTENGLMIRCSRSHAFAPMIGGFTEAVKSLGKTVHVSGGVAKIAAVFPDDFGQVFNIMTDGSHTYRANGFWSLGVGETERAPILEDVSTMRAGV